MAEAHGSFVKVHLAMTRTRHLANVENNVYPILDRDIMPDLSIRAEDAPSYKDLQDLIKKVGKPYGWDRRAEYHNPESIKNITEKLEQPSSRRFSFWSGSKEVGGVIVANVEPNIRGIFEKAISEGEEPIDINPEWAEKTIEIYKIGLLPEHTNRGWGKHFVSKILTRLFNEVPPLEVVYLNTRSTNHSGVLSFYTGLKMDVIHARSYPDDLIEEPKEAKKPARKSSRLDSLGVPPSPAMAG